MSATYRIKTLGVQDGFQRERVEARLMLMFRRPLQAVRPIADGNGALLKKGVDLATAERYREALLNCGCACAIVSAQTSGNAANTTPAAPSARPRDRAERSNQRV